MGISGDRSGSALEVGIIVVVVGEEIVGWRRGVSVALLVRRRVAGDAGLRATKAREFFLLFDPNDLFVSGRPEKKIMNGRGSEKKCIQPSIQITELALF